MTEGLILRAVKRAPFRCFACGKRFIDRDPENKYRRVGHHQTLASYIGLRRRQRFKLMLLFIGTVLVLMAFGFLSWLSYQFATQKQPKRKKY